MKLKYFFILGLIFIFACGNKIDPSPGDNCRPKWYRNMEDSSPEVVYGYSVEKSRNSSLAAKKGLASAQSFALQQINSHIKDEVIIGIEEMQRTTGNDYAEDYREAVYQEMKVATNKDCNFCVRDKYEECENDGFMVVYTRVKIDIEEYLNKDLRKKMNELLEPNEKLLEKIKE